MSSRSKAEHWAEELEAVAGRIAPQFGRAEPRRRALTYLQGLLAPLDLLPWSGRTAGTSPRQPATARVQAVVATAVCADLSSSSKASAGVLHPSVFRGLLLRAIATAARSSALCTLRSVPFGKYCRSSPLVFSFVPRCHGLCGSQK